jgi:hypothetical protein
MLYFGKAEGLVGKARAAKQKPGRKPGLPLNLTLWNAPEGAELKRPC